MLLFKLLAAVFLSCALAKGRVKPYITVERTDGFGAQLQERITCLIQSRVTPGITYVHTPMKDLDHLKSASWRQFQDLEDFINLGHGELRPEDVPADQLDVKEGCAAFVNANIPMLETFKGELLRKYQSSKGCSDSKRSRHLHLTFARPLQVHVHIRRGDVDQDNIEKWMEISHFVDIMKNVSKAAELANLLAEFHVHSEGNASTFKMLVDNFGAKLHLRKEMVPSWKAMSTADVLVMSRSSFSYTAALYNDGGLIIYTDMRPSEPLPSWLDASESVSVIVDRLNHLSILRNLQTSHADASQRQRFYQSK